jgi:hypothetical protein
LLNHHKISNSQTGFVANERYLYGCSAASTIGIVKQFPELLL